MSKNLIIQFSAILILLAICFIVYQVKKEDWFDKRKWYKLEFKNVSGLSKSSVVLYKGEMVGRVRKIYLNQEKPNSVIVEIKVDETLAVPKNAISRIISTDLINNKVIDLLFNKDCGAGNPCAEEGEFLVADNDGSILDAMMRGEETLQDKAISQSKLLLNELKERYVGSESDELIAITLRDLDALNKNMKSTQNKFKAIQEKNSSIIKRINSNTNSLMNLYKDAQPDLEYMKNTLGDISKKGDNINTSDIKKYQNQADNLMDKSDDLMKEAERQKAAYDNIMTTYKGMQEKENSFSYLMDKEGFSKDMDNTMDNLNALQGNLDEKPYYFIPFKSRKKHLKKLKKELNE